MAAQARQVLVYQDARGHAPVIAWLDGLRDRDAAAKVRVRLARVRLGNLGDHRSLGGGVIELRIDHGPGYRIYCGLWGRLIVSLLCGGDKRTQFSDIRTAFGCWADYRRRCHEGG